jgi:cyclohexa-1,5-dienecarbonyl-CoA hydratase
MPGRSPNVSPPLRVTLEEGGSLLRIRLARPPGNVLDVETIRALRAAAAEAVKDERVSTLLFCAEGANFSYGASIPEHREEAVGALLVEFHALIRELARSRRVLVAAVRGQCLGGGLELAAFCQRVVTGLDATLGNPEIRLGVFAPVASIVLPHRVGLPRAEDLLLTGRLVKADEALGLGLADQIDADPEEAALTWHREHLAGKSAASLRFAVAAARQGLVDELESRLPRLERLYLDALVKTPDAREGIAAFLEKRSPRWTHRGFN